MDAFLADDGRDEVVENWLNDTNDNFTDDTIILTNLTRPLNITADIDIRYAKPMYGCIMPFLLVITIVANTLIVLVLSKRHMRTPTNTVLMAMALADMLTLLFPAPWLFYLYTFGNHDTPLQALPACYSYYIMHEVIPALFHTASIWLTLALAVQRYIYVCHPPLARTWCTMERVNKAVIWIFVLALLHQSSRFFDQTYERVDIVWEGKIISTCSRVNSYWVAEIVTLDVYYNIYFWFRVIFVHLLPCISLVVLNVLLFGALRRAQQKRDKLFKENKKQSECCKLRDSNCTTLMLIVVVTVFLAVEIPLAVVTVLHILTSSLSLEILNYKVANILILFTNFFISLSYPINFAIYCGMSRQFRETFKDLFIRGNSVPSALPSRHNGSTRYSIVNNGAKTTVTETGV